MLTQLALYGRMMKVEIDHARVEVSGKFAAAGSVLAETVMARCDGIDTVIRVESNEAPERVAALIRNAENGCFMLQTIRNPVQTNTRVELNGTTFDYLNTR